MGMFNFEQFDGLRPGELTAFARRRFADLIQNPVRLGERVLPWVKTEDYEVAVGRVNFRGVASAIIAMDSPLPRGPLGTFSAEKYMLLKLGMKHTMIESELKKMRDVLNLRRLAPQDFARLQPYRLANSLVEGYLDRAEAMRWQALANGVIPLQKGEVEVDYNIPATHQETLTGADAWNDADDADGLADLVAWSQQVYDDTGRHVEVWFMHQTEFNALLAQDSTQQKLRLAYGTTGQQINAAGGNFDNVGMTINMVNSYLGLHGIGPIRLYDRRYNDFSFTGGGQPVPTYFLPEGKVVGVAPQPIDGGTSIDLPGASATGYCADGPVAENNFAPGLHVWFTEQDEPLEVAVKSAGWALPVISDPNTIFQAQVV